MPRRSKESVPSPLHDEPPDPTPHVSENATAADKEVEQHEEDIEDREAREYWGVMFKADKTGTDKLKALLRGLKDVMVRCA